MEQYIIRCCDCREFHPFIEAPGHGYCFVHQCEVLWNDWCNHGADYEDKPEAEVYLGMRDNETILHYLEGKEYISEIEKDIEDDDYYYEDFPECPNEK